MINFEKLKHFDMEVVHSTPTAEELREISAFLKEHRSKQVPNRKASMRRASEDKNLKRPAKLLEK